MAPRAATMSPSGRLALTYGADERVPVLTIWDYTRNSHWLRLSSWAKPHSASSSDPWARQIAPRLFAARTSPDSTACFYKCRAEPRSSIRSNTTPRLMPLRRRRALAPSSAIVWRLLPRHQKCIRPGSKLIHAAGLCGGSREELSGAAWPRRGQTTDEVGKEAPWMREREGRSPGVSRPSTSLRAPTRCAEPLPDPLPIRQRGVSGGDVDPL